MTSLERILICLDHESPDRIPFDLGSSFTTGITKNACIALARALGQPVENPPLYDVIQQLAVVDESILEQLGVDVRGLIPNVVRKDPELLDQDGVQVFEDEWGVTWNRPPESLYFTAVSSRLSGPLTCQDIDSFAWPDPTDPRLFAGLTAQARSWHEKGYAIILESLCAGIFEMGCRVRGTEQFLMDLVLEPELAGILMDKLVDIKIRFYQAAAQQIGPYVQFIREGDDVAGQESLLISPQIYRDSIKPRHQRLIAAQKASFPKPFFGWLHTDGAIYDLLPDLIDIGIDILNPLQLTAKGMDAQKIKAEYGQSLSFWGGGVNTQQILPHGTPEEVKKDVTQRIQSLKAEGGFVFGTVHNIQDDVPVENLLAMLEAFEQNRQYS
jgi:uroporphyrinogen decarboxylase